MLTAGLDVTKRRSVACTAPIMTVALPMYLRMGFEFHAEAAPIGKMASGCCAAFDGDGRLAVDIQAEVGESRDSQ